MLNSDERIAELVHKYLQESLSEHERLELEEWKNKRIENQEDFERWINSENLIASLATYQSAEKFKEHSKARMVWPSESIEQQHGAKVFSLPWKRLIAVAAVILLGFGGWLWYHQSAVDKSTLVSTSTQDLLPGRTKATLTLANGQKIILDQVKEGQIASENGTKVSKLQKGILSYFTNEKPIKPQDKTSYNILTVPKGGIYQVVLPDQSSVYLNSGSSLKYPTSFDPLTPRTVELSGEAFFTIKKDPARPFKVNVEGKIIDVLGTSFDVNGYSDEPYFTTTLLEGSIRVSNGLAQSLLLKPGQQVVGVSADHGGQNMQIVNGINTDGIIAWKTGHFHFENAPIQAVMRQFSRWYDIDVSYEGAITKELFNGDIQRNLKFTQVAEILGDYVHFKIEEKKVIVIP